EDDFSLDAANIRVEFVEAVDDQDLGLQALGRRSDAVAQPEHHERLPDWLDDLSTLATADPMWNDDLFSANVLQAVAFHFRDRPFNGSLQLRRTGQTMTDRVGEVRQSTPRERILHRLAN